MTKMNSKIEIHDMNESEMESSTIINPEFECKFEVINENVEEQVTSVITNVKQEKSEIKETTEDESVAVEALRQLGENFNPSQAPPTPAIAPVPSAIVASPNAELRISLRQHICSICGESFERKSDLGNHIVCHQVDRPHACRICGNLFRRKADLQNHMVCHQMERPHRCPQCGTDFQRHSSLANHMKIHTYLPGRALVPPCDIKPVFRGFTKDSSNKMSVPQEQQFVNGWNENRSINILPNNPDDNPPPHDVTHDEVTTEQQSLQSCNDMQHINTESTITNCAIENLPQNQTMEIVEQIAPVDQTSETSTEVHLNDRQQKQKPQHNLADTDQKSASERRPHICRHCGVGFSRVKALESHAKLHQDYWGSPLECEKCEEMFPEELSLKQHQRTCSGKLKSWPRVKDDTEYLLPTPVSYPIPNFKFQTNHSTPTKLGKHQCSECEKRFATKQKLYRHMWIHRKLQHLCESCGLYLENGVALDEHRRTHHAGDTPHPCLECGKNFASRQGLWEHGRVHGATSGQGSAGNPPLSCQQCGKKFSSRQGHLIHMRIHTGERPYGCRFCFKAFRDGGTLRKHERIHTGERPHACPLCYRAFNQKVVLREHVRWVHAAKNATGCHCPLCNHVAVDRESLCAHIVKHSDQMAADAKANKLMAKYFNDSTNTQNTSPSTTVPVTSSRANNAVQSNSNVQKRSKKNKKEYSCDMCGEKFKERTQLLNHVPVHI